LKWLVGARGKMRRTLLSCDLWSNEWTAVAAGTRRADCTVCGGRDFAHLQGEGRPHITLCGRNSVQIHERARLVDLAEMEARLVPHGTVRRNELLLRFERGDITMTLFADGRAILQGTSELAVARSFYARFVGS
jgi:hypothetical protein